LRDRWNEVVRDNDLVYVLGDVAFNKIALNSLGQFKGRKILVMGNHDKFHTKDYLFVFDDVYAACVIDGIVLTHIPIHPNSLQPRWKGNIHGHLHSRVVTKTIEIDRGNVECADISVTHTDARYLCVSAEHINLTPIEFDEAKLRMEIQNETEIARNSKI
jgi:calcineurin-like phosphoesterase family protein